MQSASKPNETLQEKIKRLNDMQYEAMANAQAGQVVSDQFTKEFTNLEQEIAKLTAEQK